MYIAMCPTMSLNNKIISVQRKGKGGNAKSKRDAMILDETLFLKWYTPPAFFSSFHTATSKKMKNNSHRILNQLGIFRDPRRKRKIIPYFTQVIL